MRPLAYTTGALDNFPVDVVILTETLDKDDLLHCLQQLGMDTDRPIGSIVLLDAPLEIQSAKFDTYLINGATDVTSLGALGSDIAFRLLLVDTLIQQQRHFAAMIQRHQTETKQRKILETRLKFLLMHDELTGLFNFRKLEQHIEWATREARQGKQANGLIYFDICQFKLINDIDGHKAGNALLQRVASTLRQELEEQSVFARIGGDEFAILLPKSDKEHLLQVAARLQTRLNQLSIQAKDYSFHISASFGAALQTPTSADNAQQFFFNAKHACRLAKIHDRSQIYFFNQEDEDEAVKVLQSDLKWAHRISEAIEQELFFLVFQPVMDVDTQTIHHFEVLLRMRGKQGEMISPYEFIPVAERNGQIQKIDLWVIEHALDILGSLHPQYPDISFGINLSAQAFREKSMLPLIREKINEYQLSPSSVVFEITETAAITGFREVRDMLFNLRALGCRFALDDFGSGFASYNYLKQFPVDLVKIDGSFILNLPNNSMDQLLVKSMVDVIKGMDKKIVAEFVGDPDILELVRQYGVDYAQGFYIGRPQEDLVAMLSHSRTH